MPEAQCAVAREAVQAVEGPYRAMRARLWGIRHPVPESCPGMGPYGADIGGTICFPGTGRAPSRKHDGQAVMPRGPADERIGMRQPVVH
jgi:hypothetical protein